MIDAVHDAVAVFNSLYKSLCQKVKIEEAGLADAPFGPIGHGTGIDGHCMSIPKTQTSSFPNIRLTIFNFIFHFNGPVILRIIPSNGLIRY
jgi:hypothetical protein